MKTKTFRSKEGPARKAVVLSAALSALILALGIPFAAPARAAEAADPFAPGASLVAADAAAASGGRESWAADMPAMEITWLDLKGARLMAYGSGQAGGDGVFGLSLGRGTGDGGFENLYVALDNRGTVLFRSDYNTVERFSDGFMIAGRYVRDDRVRQPGELSAPPVTLYTYVDKAGRELIPPGSYAEITDFHEGLAAVAAGTNGDPVSGDFLWGYLDATGALAIPPRFKAALDFREGLAPVRDAASGKWGFIDRSGQPVIPFAYDLALPFSEGLAYVQLDGRAGYIDKENRVAIPIELAAELPQSGNPNWMEDPDPSFYRGRAVVRVNAEFRHYVEYGNERAVDHLYGYIDTSGAFVIEPKLFGAQPFYREHVLVTYANAAFTILPSALIDRDGARVTPFWNYSFFDYASAKGGADLHVVSGFALNERGVGVLNGNGAELVPLRFTVISEFDDDGVALAVVNEDPEKDPRVALLRARPESALPQAGRLIKIEIDGERLPLPDADPVIENGRTLVPMRYIFEALGAEVSWNEAEQSVRAEKEGTELRLQIGASAARVNGAEILLDTAPVIRGGRTLVPIRFIAESLGARVDWDAERRTVVIDTRNMRTL
jgi:hypothetical protein